MVGKHAGRKADSRLRTLIVVAASIASLAVLGGASPALATEHHPTGDFTPFADCPLSNPAVEQCIVANTTGGEFKIGTRTVPISGTVTLQGGTHEDSSGALEFFGAEDGNTLSKTELFVPGGLLGVVAPEALPKFLQEAIDKLVSEGLAEVTATAELAKPASEIGISDINLLTEEGVALTLPVKVKLSNTFLGSKCYIGSSSNPVYLNLTTGTTAPPEKGTPNKPIKGTRGSIVFKDEFNIVDLTGSSLVDNSFSAPKASGCGGLLAILINPAVNIELALPSPSGYNTAILNGSLEQANAEATLASE
jgi:hypothetical protein